MATSSVPSDAANLFEHPSRDDPAGQQPFNRDQGGADALPPAPSPVEKDLTVQMTSLFLVLMVLYVGFFAYRWSKTWGSDREIVERSARRRRNQRVLDASLSVSTRALQSAEEQAKLEERKRNIGQALTLRLIVEEEEDGPAEERVGGDAASAAGEEMARGVLDAESSAEGVVAPVHEGGESTVAVNAPEVAASAQETTAAEAEVDRDDAEAPSGPVTAMVPCPPATSPASSPSSPRRSQLSAPSRLLSPFVTCATTANASCGGLHGKLKHALGKEDGQGTISLAAVVGTYGEECNICLSKFQVGDSAAWRKHPRGVMGSGGDRQGQGTAVPPSTHGAVSGVPNDAGNATPEAGVEHLCNHVFHEECISRWLLVRDGCPICRRSYFRKDPSNATIVEELDPSPEDLEQGTSRLG